MDNAWPLHIFTYQVVHLDIYTLLYIVSGRYRQWALVDSRRYIKIILKRYRPPPCNPPRLTPIYMVSYLVPISWNPIVAENKLSR